MFQRVIHVSNRLLLLPFKIELTYIGLFHLCSVFVRISTFIDKRFRDISIFIFLQNLFRTIEERRSLYLMFFVADFDIIIFGAVKLWLAMHVRVLQLIQPKVCQLFKIFIHNFIYYLFFKGWLIQGLQPQYPLMVFLNFQNSSNLLLINKWIEG